MKGNIKYVASACLAGVPCRFDGASRPCQEVVNLRKAGCVLLVCPETLAGLKSPRLPCEQRGDMVICENGQDMTDIFLMGAEKALEQALASGARIAILKSRSPSCGVGQVYDGTFRRMLIPGNGIWTRKLLEAGFSVFDEEHLPNGL